ncbi:MAG: hypothetical protein ACFFB3_17095 [Candidatus Hodarchaeota archaeon]
MMLSRPQEDEITVLESTLEKIPSFHLTYLATKWSKTPQRIPEGLNGQQKLKALHDIIGSISKSKFQHFRKLEKFLTFDTTWSPFLIGHEFVLHQVGLIKRFSAKEYFPNPRVAVNGKLHSFEIEPGIFLLVAEFSSRSSLLRTYRRFVIVPELNLMLAEHDSLGRKLLTDLLQPFLNLKLDNLAINSMVLRDISKEWTEISGMTSLVTTETAGVEGLETVAISGTNVLSGAEELKSAKEMASSLLSIGPWVGIKTVNFTLNIYKGLKFRRFVLEDMRRLKEILEVED